MTKDSEQEELLNDILDTLITEISNYIERAVNGEYPILFVGSFKNRAMKRLKQNLILKAEAQKRVSALYQDRERYALSKQIEENQMWVNIYLRTQEELENVGGSGSMTWRAVKQNILDHEERVAGLKARLSKLIEEEQETTNG